MLVVETIAKIRRAYFVHGQPIEAIRRELGVSRKVVRKVILSEATEFRYKRETQPLPKMGPWSAALDRLLAANESKTTRERLTLIRSFEELRGLRYAGRYDAVRRYARRWSRECGASTTSAYVPLKRKAEREKELRQRPLELERQERERVQRPEQAGIGRLLDGAAMLRRATEIRAYIHAVKQAPAGEGLMRRRKRSSAGRSGPLPKPIGSIRSGTAGFLKRLTVETAPRVRRTDFNTEQTTMTNSRGVRCGAPRASTQIIS